MNIPLSVQPWGRDGDKRRYWLIEGQDDTDFRVYRESNPALKTTTWWSVAGSIDELRVLAAKLQDDDGSREAKALGERMLHAVPRFEATEEVIMLLHHHCTVANCSTEAQASRIPSRSQGCLRPPRTRLLPLRRPHSWEANEVYFFG